LWLRAAPTGLARALFGADRVGLGHVWRRESAHFDATCASAPWESVWLSVPFDVQAAPSPRWSSFGQVRHWTPRVEWRRGEGLTVRAAAGRREWQATLALLAALEEGLAPPGRQDGKAALVLPDPTHAARHRWEEQVETALRAMQGPRATLEKVVLARRVTLPLPDATSPLDLLDALWRREPEGWPYFLSWRGGRALFGVTPERLFQRRGRLVDSMALAGTRPRGRDVAEDRALGRDLLAGEKERHEQQVVSGWLREHLQPLCRQPVRVGARSLRRLGHVQHLQSSVRGHLRAGVDDAHLLAALHPTPALCGEPRPRAMDWIRQHEGLDRGLYGGVLGLLSEQEACCMVAIRGALFTGRRLELQAGAGLVKGSQAEDEWQETGYKLQALTRAWRSR